MSKADKMFEKLGYKKTTNDMAEIYTKKIIRGIRQLAFHKDKHINLDIEFMTLEELQAINEKCKELGWNE